MEVAVDDFVSIFEKADSSTMRTIDFCLSNINDFIVFKELGSVEGGFGAQNKGGTVFDHQQFFKFEFNVPEFSSNEGSFIVEIVQIKLSFL